MVWINEFFHTSPIWLCIIIIAAILLDLVIGDPRWLPHPVIKIGRLITILEKRMNDGDNRVAKGVVFTASVIIIVFLFTTLSIYLAYLIHPVLGLFLQIYLISTTIAIKGLSAAAKDILLPLTKGDLLEARRKLSMVVGRDTQSLPEAEIVRGATETVAENTVDGITAPLFWAFIGGAPFSMVYRAINTLDSMVGYKNETYQQFGWASARLDDAVNWLPARITSVSILISAFLIKGANIRNGWKTLLRDAKKHPSPNSGWSEAVVAGLLGVQLGGVNYYKGQKSERATMGDPLRPLVQTDIKRTIIFMHGGWLTFTAMGVTVLVFISKIM